MKYIDQWLSGLGLDHLVPLLQEHGITTPKKLAQLSLRDMYEVVGVENAEDRKTLYYLIERLRTILKKDGDPDQESSNTNFDNNKQPSTKHNSVNISPLRRVSNESGNDDSRNSYQEQTHNQQANEDVHSSMDEDDLKYLRHQHKQQQNTNIQHEQTNITYQSTSNNRTQHGKVKGYVDEYIEPEVSNLRRNNSNSSTGSTTQGRSNFNNESVLGNQQQSIPSRSSLRAVPPNRQESNVSHAHVGMAMGGGSGGGTSSTPRIMSPITVESNDDKHDYEGDHASKDRNMRSGYAPIISHRVGASINMGGGGRESSNPVRYSTSPPPAPPPHHEEGGHKYSNSSNASSNLRHGPQQKYGASSNSQPLPSHLQGRPSVSDGHNSDYGNAPSGSRVPPQQQQRSHGGRGYYNQEEPDQDTYHRSNQQYPPSKQQMGQQHQHQQYHQQQQHHHQQQQQYQEDEEEEEEYDHNTSFAAPNNSLNIVDMAIRVIVRKRPLSKSELAKGDRDVMEMPSRGQVLVHEPKIKVDLTKVVESQTFFFDDAFEDFEPNELIYVRAIAPLINTVFEGGKASCFAYGQTGSGKTFTMMGCKPTQPSSVTENAGLYVLAARDIFHYLIKNPSRGFKVYVSCFEIYGGKLYDLLNDRGVVKCLEDAKQQVQLPGLTEHDIGSVEALLQMMSRAHLLRSVGSTGANMESSRSHQILQLSIKVQISTGVGKNKKLSMKDFGKLSFIDLAGSERGADTNHNSKQTRMEGAEINTSLLALKEVIRSLERKHGHTPFRGSKLTQVLKDSFVGEKTRTCMIACVSPSHTNCEHTLNTLRYADRVKEHQSSNSGANDDSFQAAQPAVQASSRPSTARAQSAMPARSANPPSRPATASAATLENQNISSRGLSSAGSGAPNRPTGVLARQAEHQNTPSSSSPVSANDKRVGSSRSSVDSSAMGMGMGGGSRDRPATASSARQGTASRSSMGVPPPDYTRNTAAMNSPNNNSNSSNIIYNSHTSNTNTNQFPNTGSNDSNNHSNASKAGSSVTGMRFHRGNSRSSTGSSNYLQPPPASAVPTNRSLLYDNDGNEINSYQQRSNQRRDEEQDMYSDSYTNQPRKGNPSISQIQNVSKIPVSSPVRRPPPSIPITNKSKLSIDSNEDDRSDQYSNIRRKGSSPAPSPPSSPDIDLGGPRLGIHKPDRSYGGGNNALLSLTALAEAQHQEDIDNIGGDYYGEDVVKRGGGHNTKASQHQQHVRNSAERGNMSSGASKQQQQQQQQLSASTMLLQKTVDLLSAHKSAIAHMVEVMKDEMELVQEMEQAEDRDSEQYADQLQQILDSKTSSVEALRTKLKLFQKYRNDHHEN